MLMNNYFLQGFSIEFLILFLREFRFELKFFASILLFGSILSNQYSLVSIVYNRLFFIINYLVDRRYFYDYFVYYGFLYLNGGNLLLIGYYFFDSRWESFGYYDL